MPRLISVAAACLIVLAAARVASAQAPPQGLPVTVAPPLFKRVTTWDEYSGRFEAVERVDVRPRVGGFIDKVHFKDGSLVKIGDLLFTLDKRPFEIAVESAKAEIARQEAQVQFALADLERAAPLAASKVMSEQVFDQRKATLSQAQAQLAAAKASLRSAELNLEWSDVRAPIAGRISDKKVDPGNVVAGGGADATLLARIVSIDPIHFVFDVSETDYLRYARLNLSGARQSSRDIANPVKVKLADETEFIHPGRMDFVDNALNERAATMRGRAVFENTDSLFSPGMFARLALFGGDVESFLIPDLAIVSDQARKIVFTVNDENTVVATPVTLGPIIDGLRVIKSGLKSADRIIIEGLANPAVRPGAKVVPTDGTIQTAKK